MIAVYCLYVFIYKHQLAKFIELRQGACTISPHNETAKNTGYFFPLSDRVSRVFSFFFRSCGRVYMQLVKISPCSW